MRGSRLRERALVTADVFELLTQTNRFVQPAHVRTALHAKKDWSSGGQQMCKGRGRFGGSEKEGCEETGGKEGRRGDGDSGGMERVKCAEDDL